MHLWSNIKLSDSDVEMLVQVIREAGRPVHMNNLARELVRARLLTEKREVRRYTHSETYAVGEKVRWKGNFGEVKAVADGENPRQGKFVILTLVFPDGNQVRLAAKPGGEEIQDRRSVSDEKVRAIVREYGLAIRTAIQDAMRKDVRFAWFEDAQGDNWCLTEMLPEVENEGLAKVFPLLQGLLKDGVLSPRLTDDLVKTIWGLSNDGSDEYALKAFALNVALQGCNDTRWMGNGWVLESEWQKLQERESLIGPRQPSKIELPEGVTLDTSGESEAVAGEVEEEEEPEEQETPIPEDLEAWRRNRRLNATITLRARHYYGNYLPLNKDMRRVFPPRASGTDAVTFYHHFGDEQESFQAWVDWNQGRILGSPQMYQAFYDYGIYPGAALVISHRENEQEYDIRTKPPTKDEPVRVRRVSFTTDENGNRIMDEDGHPKLKYDEIDEPRRYEIADDVFIVGASWENLPELFAEAERVGQGYFGLMYEVCCEWWEANGRKPLYVTADELFQEIHYNRRLVTSEATIPWELWRRLAFKPVGDGRYLFRPQMGDRTRSVGPRSRPSRARETRRGVQVKRDKSLLEIAKQSQPEIIHIELKPEVSKIEAFLLQYLVNKGISIEEIVTQTQKQEFTSNKWEDVPQADDVEKIESFPFKVKNGINTAEKMAYAYGFTSRISHFYRNASEILGLVKSRGGRYILTSIGELYVNLPGSRERKILLILLMLRLPIVKVALEESNISKIAEIIHKKSNLSWSTAERRAMTIQTWIRWLRLNFRTVTQTELDFK